MRRSRAIDSHSISKVKILKDTDIFCSNKECEQLCTFNSNCLSFLSAATYTEEIHPNSSLWNLLHQPAIEPLTFLSRSLRAQGTYIWSAFICCGGAEQDGAGALRSRGQQHPTLNPKAAFTAKLFQLDPLLGDPCFVLELHSPQHPFTASL